MKTFSQFVLENIDPIQLQFNRCEQLIYRLFPHYATNLSFEDPKIAYLLVNELAYTIEEIKKKHNSAKPIFTYRGANSTIFSYIEILQRDLIPPLISGSSAMSDQLMLEFLNLFGKQLEKRINKEQNVQMKDLGYSDTENNDII